MIQFGRYSQIISESEHAAVSFWFDLGNIFQINIFLIYLTLYYRMFLCMMNK